jgi:hypothetical protein
MGTRKDEKGNAGNRRCLQVLRVPEAVWQGLPRNLKTDRISTRRSQRPRRLTFFTEDNEGNEGKSAFYIGENQLPLVLCFLCCLLFRISFRGLCDLLVEILSVRSLFPTTYEAAR